LEGDGEEWSEGEDSFMVELSATEWFGSDAEGDDEAEDSDVVDESTGDVEDCLEVDNRSRVARGGSGRTS
jgi:hypothetical protein